MSKTYVIRWKSKINGRAGKGTKLFDKGEAEQLVQELNREYPDIEHELLDTEGQPERGLTPAQAKQPQEQTPLEEAEKAPSDALSFGE
ncbi:MAG TPA: hypothetical protein VG167_14715 [Verrucomicrobiae bacterium]|nr:hypothetical protein [Verrucomicrobiae bacterium]